MDILSKSNENYLLGTKISDCEENLELNNEQKEVRFDTFTRLNVFNNNFFTQIIPRHYSTELIPKNNIIINSAINNKITIINNIIKNYPKKKESTSTQSKKSNLKKLFSRQSQKNVKFSNEVLQSPSTSLLDLDITKKKRQKIKEFKRNKSLFLNKKFTKINIQYFKDINKRRSVDFLGTENEIDDLNTLNKISNDSKSYSLNNLSNNEIKNLIELDNIKEMKIHNELKELFKIKGEICMHIKHFGIFKGFSAISFVNGEEYNEDKLGISLNIPLSEHHHRHISNFFAIYDGHNGDKISKYLKGNFHNLLYKNEKFISHPDEAIYNTFENIEQTLINIKDNCGSSALILLNIDKDIYVANLGDSRAIISIDNCYEISQLSKEHNINNKSEKQRIEKFGGKIQEIEENDIKIKKIFPGNLTITRSFGDFNSKLKIYNGIPNMISSVPDLIRFKYNENIDFIFLCSHGLIEYMNNYEICNIVYNTLKEGILNDLTFEKTIENINTKIINEAIERGSKKNLSFIFLAMNNIYRVFHENKINNVNQSLARLNILIKEPDTISRNAYIETFDISNHKKFPFSTLINKFYSPPSSLPDPNIFLYSIEENNDNNNSLDLKNTFEKNKKKKKKSLIKLLCFLNCGMD